MALRRSRTKNRFRSESKLKEQVSLKQSFSQPPLLEHKKSLSKREKDIESLGESEQTAKSRGIFKMLTPINLKREKKIFFRKNYEYDPYFLYEPEVSIEKQLKKYSVCDEMHLKLALSILDKSLQENIPFLLTQEKTITKQQVERKINQFLQQLQLKDQLQYEFVQDSISPMTFIHSYTNSDSSKNKLLISLPIHYKESMFEGVLYHEIGTHFLRRYNQNYQRWSNIRQKYKISDDYLSTEQGLAALNQLLPCLTANINSPLLYKASLNYYSCYLASKYSFKEQFSILRKYQPDQEANWKCCIRSRRGISDTSKKGGMHKDQVYLRGAIQLLRKRKQINFKQLYSGKISIFDCLRLSEEKIIQNHKVKLPPFMKNLDEYTKCLDQIAKANMI